MKPRSERTILALAALVVLTASLSACAPATRRTVVRIPETQWTDQRDRERAAEIVAAQQARGESPAVAPAYDAQAYEAPAPTYRRPAAPLRGRCSRAVAAWPGSPRLLRVA